MFQVKGKYSLNNIFIYTVPYRFNKRALLVSVIVSTGALPQRVKQVEKMRKGSEKGSFSRLNQNATLPSTGHAGYSSSVVLPVICAYSSRV